MQVDNEDRLSDENPSSGLPVVPLVLGVALVVIAAAWYFLGTGEPEAPAAPPPPEPAVPAVPAQPAPPPAPDIPEKAPEPVEPAQPIEPETPEPPPLRVTLVRIGLRNANGNNHNSSLNICSRSR